MRRGASCLGMAHLLALALALCGSVPASTVAPLAAPRAKATIFTATATRSRRRCRTSSRRSRPRRRRGTHRHGDDHPLEARTAHSHPATAPNGNSHLTHAEPTDAGAADRDPAPDEHPRRQRGHHPHRR